MKKNERLITRLAAYSQSDMYPFHMPGHKRLAGAKEEFDFPNPFSVDITEIDGFDNLHHPEGILKESMEWAAGVYGADKTCYLVNGSSSGLMAAVSGCVPRGGHILMCRNCHKSVYNAVFLNQLKVSYVYPQEVKGLGIQGGILPSDVEAILEKEPDISAVLIVSPTYDGVVSDIKSIAEIVHRAGLPLIVDEAHGAHFRYHKMFPQSALELGADVVIQSIHKTLPSLTQTALLHMKCSRPDGGSYMDMGAVDKYLHIYQSTSPSYVLMASIENAIFQMEQAGPDTELGRHISKYEKALEELRGRLSGLKVLRLADQDMVGKSGIYDLDVSKIVVSTRDSAVSGAWLDDVLRKEFHLEMEMCGADYVTAISSVMDSEAGLKRLGDALMEIDGRLEKGAEPRGILADFTAGEADGFAPDAGKCAAEATGCIYSQANEIAMTISEASESPWKTVPLKNSENRVSAEFVYIYPPGIPIVAPGERINGRVLDIIMDYIRKGLPVQGPADESLTVLRVVEE